MHIKSLLMSSAGAGLAFSMALAGPAFAQQPPVASDDTQPAAPPNGASAAATVAPAATAASAPPSVGNPSPPPPVAALAEVVVTAQKRSQNLQAVPVAVTAISAQMIQDKRIENFQDLTRAAPSLTLTQGSTSVNDSIVLRGIGTNSPSPSVESSVAVVVDDVAVVNQAQAFTGLSDVQQIEVLRGPQGTLFGRNASAGVVNITTAPPSSTFTGSAQQQVETDSEVRTNASFSGPISPDAGFRLSAYYEHQPGYLNNVALNTDSNSLESYGARLRLSYHPINILSLSFIVDYSHNIQDGVNYTYRYVQPGAKVLNLLPIDLTGQKPGSGNYNISLDDNGPALSRQLLTSGHATLNLGPVDLVSITSYQDWYTKYNNDVDNSAQDVLNPYTHGAVNGGPIQAGPYHILDFAQEFRLLSKFGGPFSFLLGAYYSDSKVERDFIRGPSYAVADWRSYSGDRILAGFVQTEYHFTPTTRITAGARLNYDHISVDFTNYNQGLAACLVTCIGAHGDTSLTGKIALQHDLAQHTMVYASFATGYKGYGYNVGTGFNTFLANNPVKPENSDSYELGLKSRLFDQRLQLNVTGFLTDYSNLQATSNVLNSTANPPVLQATLLNVGEIRTKGVEVESSARPLSWLKFDASVAYVDATITSFPDANCFAGQVSGPGTACVNIDPVGQPAHFVQNLAGHGLPNAPKVKATLGSVADFPLGDSGLRGIATLDYQYQSTVHFDLFDSPLTYQKSYGLLNGGFGLTKGNLSARVFVNNIFNKHYAVFLTDAYASFGNYHVVEQDLTRDSERYAGITFGVKF